MAAKMNGHEGALPFEVINRTASAHFTGGIPIGDSNESGAVDPYLRLFGQPGSSRHRRERDAGQPGVNPSLMITALVERAMSLWPNKGDMDPGRPWAPGTSASIRSHPTDRSCPQALRPSCDSTRTRPRHPRVPVLTGGRKGEDDDVISQLMPSVRSGRAMRSPTTSSLRTTWATARRGSPLRVSRTASTRSTTSAHAPTKDVRCQAGYSRGRRSCASATAPGSTSPPAR